MATVDHNVQKYVRRLLLSRMRILVDNGFYGLLLMHMKFALDGAIRTACTDGDKIYFSPAFMDELSDSELDFVLMHEILHVVLQHCSRKGDRDRTLFNIACDIVANSNILKSCDMRIEAITLKKYGTAMHIAPDGEEGYNYTAEEVYRMLCEKAKLGPGHSRSLSGFSEGWDDHSKWGDAAGDDPLTEDVWTKHLQEAAEAISAQIANGGRATLPMFAQRYLAELKAPKTDWRTLLTDFVQEEVTDYSFSPPDKRFGDGDFFMPDFNDESECVKNVLFMVDASGSISDEMLSTAFSEIKGAIEQFNGRLQGLLGFFDAAVYPPQPFESVEDLLAIKPMGGGGTAFDIIFDYVFSQMENNLPASIVIITDGLAPFPDEEDARGIPVLWLVNNNSVTPPWGKIARVLDE